MNINEVFGIFLKNKRGRPFVDFSNADGKRWLMPVRNMSTGMKLYQPSGAKGKLVKWGLPWLYWTPGILHFLHAKQYSLSFRAEFLDLIRQIFDLEDFEFAVFCGTPGVHQKITIQISCGSKIFGYLKITDNKNLLEVFMHEREILSTLHNRGVDNVPKCLYCGTLSNGLHVFAQTTVKTRHSKVLHYWSSLHVQFLEALKERTSQQIQFEESDFYRDLMGLRSNGLVIKETILNDAIESVLAHYAGEKVQFCAFHADFTPWNMFVESGQLFVFDWEYARLTYPPRLDFFHFWLQTSIFEKHLSVEQVVADYRYIRQQYANDFSDIYFSLKCYLLVVIALYVEREKGVLNLGTQQRIEFWSSLLKQL